MSNKINTADRAHATPPARGGGMGGGGRGRMMGGGGGRGHHGMPGEKPKNFSRAWKTLLAFCRSYLGWMAVAVIIAGAAAVLSIIGPDILSRITDLIKDGLVTGIDLYTVSRLGIVLAVMYGLSAVFNYLQSFIMNSVSHRVSYRMRDAISKKINRMPLKYFDTSSTGDVLSRVTNDVDGVSSNLSNISALVAAVTTLVGSVVMMFITNGLMAAAAIGSSLLGFAAMIFIIAKSQKHFVAQQAQLGKINGHIEEAYTGHQIIKAYNAEPAVRAEFEEINTGLYSSAWKSQFLSGMMMPLMGFVGNLGYAAVCVVGAVLVIQGTATIGVIAAFMIYVRLFNQPLSQIAQVANALQATAAAAERVFDFLGEEELAGEKDKESITIKDVKGEVQFSNVKFGYLPDKTVINDFSATVKAGQKAAIVGPTGAGKTTIVNLLMRFYELDGGKILIDGIDISTLTRENVHDMFCMVLQDTWLFNGTVTENIVYSKQGVTKDQVIQACKIVGVDHFIRTLPKGYDTVLDENVAISAGQKQLITIARAVVEDAPLLILDEATSSVDTRTEVLIQRAMDGLTKGRTSFVIAHRLSTIKNADIILVLKDGDIVQSGTHGQLLAQGGFYSELYNSQFERDG